MGALLYKPFALVVKLLAGFAAGAIFKRIWAKAARDPEPPEPTERRRTWQEVAIAAAVYGAVAGGVKALAERGGAKAFARLTGTWPGSKG